MDRGQARGRASLATSWGTNADATVWTFNLGEGVKWHDGTPLTADDVNDQSHS
ncbi:MAG: hypothetical protein KF735_22440 [Chelatococcus sp.]|nr:hypothetical protein [Chelatococcus sp.]